MGDALLEAWAREFRSELNLGTCPIGVRLFEKASEAMEVPGVKVLRSTATCHMAALARHHCADGITVTTAQGMKCLWGSACLGLMQTPERLARGDLNLAFTRDEDAAHHLQDNIFMLGNEGRMYSAVLMAPLDLMPVQPDAIVAYMTPGQSLKVLLGYEYREGRVLKGTTLTGQSTICSAIARVMNGEDMVLDVPCVGDRTWGLVPDQELVVVISPEIFGEVLEGMKATDKFASHPFRPFLDWSVIFPPDMEPRQKELD
jgi:uncharacterized protein (DUF169 family)